MTSIKNMASLTQHDKCDKHYKYNNQNKRCQMTMCDKFEKMWLNMTNMTRYDQTWQCD